MGLISSFFKRYKILKLAKQARKICGDERLIISYIAQGIDPYEKIREEFISIVLSYDSYDWQIIKKKHSITRHTLEELWNELSLDKYVFHRTLHTPLYLPIMVLDFSSAVEYLLDYRDDLPLSERNRTALQYTLKEISSVPNKPLN